MRSREDDWQATEDDAQAAGLNTTTLIAHGMEVMQGYLRCHRGDCNADAPPVPVMFGDLTGKTLGEWVIAAVNLAVSQHPNHEPVWIGRTVAAGGLVLGSGGLVRRRRRLSAGDVRPGR